MDKLYPAFYNVVAILLLFLNLATPVLWFISLRPVPLGTPISLVNKVSTIHPMSPASTIISASKGDFVCRPTSWTDVTKFILLNYGLHALTVIPEPGQGRWPSVLAGLGAFFLPFAGVARAIFIIARCAKLEPSSLKAAARARALCMVIPNQYRGCL